MMPGTETTPTGTLVGYARVSTTDQDIAAQTDRLNTVGCTRIFTETVSGALRERPRLRAQVVEARSANLLEVGVVTGKNEPVNVHAMLARRKYLRR